MGGAKVRLYAGVARELLGLGDLPAPVIRRALTHGLSHGIELVAECLQHMRCVSRVGVQSLDQYSTTKRVVRSTSAPMVLALPLPLMGSPCQRSGNWLSSVLGWRTWMLKRSVICPLRYAPLERSSVWCGPCAGRPVALFEGRALGCGIALEFSAGTAFASPQGTGYGTEPCFCCSPRVLAWRSLSLNC